MSDGPLTAKLLIMKIIHIPIEEKVLMASQVWPMHKDMVH